MAVDLSSLVSDIGAQAVPLASVALAVLAVYLVIIVYRWVRVAVGISVGIGMVRSLSLADQLPAHVRAEAVVMQGRADAEDSAILRRLGAGN